MLAEPNIAPPPPRRGRMKIDDDGRITDGPPMGGAEQWAYFSGMGAGASCLGVDLWSYTDGRTMWFADKMANRESPHLIRAELLDLEQLTEAVRDLLRWRENWPPRCPDGPPPPIGGEWVRESP